MDPSDGARYEPQRMRTQTTRLTALLGLTAALVIAAAPMPTDAQSAERTKRIDGSNAARFETSVALLQNDLPARRRQDFDVALAMIWLRNTVDSDFDDDGDTDLDDIRRLEQDADDLVTAIRRGNLVSAVLEREAPGGEYTVADYFQELDGLGYDEVVGLAGVERAESELSAALKRWQRGSPCASLGEQSVVRSTRCDGFSSPPGRATGGRAGQILNDAMKALIERDFAAARTAIARLPLERLSSYERSKVEQMLFSISYEEGKYAEARQHLENALDAGGLNAPEVADALGRIRVLDTQLSGRAP